MSAVKRLKARAQMRARTQTLAQAWALTQDLAWARWRSSAGVQVKLVR